LNTANVALDGKVLSSKRRRSSYDAKLTDGDLCDFKYDTKACCSRTGISREPWFNIEMEQTYNILQVNLKTYTEDAYRLTDAEIRVGDSKDIRENEICAVISKRPKAGRLNKYECTGPMKGKYVGVIIPNKFENLIICELEAFQVTDLTPAASSSSSSSSSSFFSSNPFDNSELPLNPPIMNLNKKDDEEEPDWFADFGATISDSSDSSFAKDLRASFGASSSVSSASASSDSSDFKELPLSPPEPADYEYSGDFISTNDDEELEPQLKRS